MSEYKQLCRRVGQAEIDQLRSHVLAQREFTDDEVIAIGDLALYSEFQVDQMIDWINQTVHYTHRVNSGTPTREEVSLFWIRAAGVLGDIRTKERERVESYEGFLPPSGHDGARRELDARKAFLAALDAVASWLDDDDLYVLHHKRVIECHPWQSKYRAQLANGALKKVGSEQKGGQRELGASEDTLRRCYAENNGDGRAIAKRIASKICLPLMQLQGAAASLDLARFLPGDP